jgi:hypothetical protein
MENIENGIPLLEIELSNGDKVMVRPFLTIGQTRDVQAIMLEQGDFDVEIGKLKKVPVKAYMQVQDKAADFLIKEIKKKDGTVVPYTKEWLYNLSPEDGNKVYTKVSEIFASSNLSNESKKK